MMKKTSKYKRNILTPDKVLTRYEVKSLLRAIDTRRFLGRRDLAIIQLLLATGLRKNELLSLDVGNYHKHKNESWIEFTAKGGETHTQGFPHQPAGAAIDIYFRFWGLDNNLNVPMFQSAANKTTPTGRRLSAQSLEFMLRKYGKKAGITKHLHPHMLRHTAGTEFYLHSQNLADTQAFMRHKNISSSLIYLHGDNKRVSEVQKMMFKG